MRTNPETEHHSRKQTTADEATQLRHQLSELVKEVRCTIADPARPEGLKEALAQSQMLLR